ncbi:hypothetical protein FGG08_002550 [Glutinoglossum americanum]|uniref:Uncharacterized protein n=1 Tax=Glutinoglossum americanum TaxID=1670608 RepID=A0A9P8I9G4_9PEZI|nr:hypothetical protein FGG08_002550 [Glutinoglossum americanum]
MECRISEAHAKCFLSFVELISVIENPVRDFRDQAPLKDVLEEFDRYKLWAGNVGAAHSGKYYQISLDYRLREASFYKTQGKRKPFEELSFLDDKSQSDPTPPSDGDSDGQAETDDSPWEISSSSGDDDQPDPGDRPKLLDKYGTSSSTQQATVGTQQFSSAMIPVQKPAMEMPQLIESVKFTITCLYKMPIRRPASLDRLIQKASVDASFYQAFDVLYVKDKFPQLDTMVATRLGKMISRRRQLLFYRLSHNDGLQTSKVEPKVALSAPLATKPLSLEKSDSGLEAASEAAVSKVAQSQAASSRYTLHTKATTLRLNAPQVDTIATLYAPSIAESELSMPSSYSGENLRVEVPPRPKGKDNKDLDRFECPYCLVAQFVKTDRAWKKHVLGDLQPREEWYKHEIQRHRVEWFCNIEGHPRYAERSDFLTHMELAHSTTFNDNQRSLLLNMFQCASRSLVGNCNLCLRSSVKLKSHVSRHLEQIALFALPRVNEAAGTGTAELNSHFSEQNVNGSTHRGRPQKISQESESSLSRSQSKQSQPADAQPEGPSNDDPVDQITIPDGADSSWDTITDKFSKARMDLHQETAPESEPKPVLRSVSGLEPWNLQKGNGKAPHLAIYSVAEMLNDDIFRRRQEGTGEWLLNADAFEKWQDGTERTLWCPGIPGAGKTILTSIVVDYLERSFGGGNIAVACIYCSYKEKEGQTVVNLIASLLRQLIQKNAFISNEISSLYHHHIEKQTRPTFDEWFKLLQSEAHHLSKVFIVIDALDECPESNGTRDGFLTEIQKLPNIHLLVTSRHIPSIERVFGKAARMEVQASNGDVRRYLECRIMRDHRLVRRIEADPALQEAIINAIIEKAKGMFLLAQLHMDSLLRKETCEDVRKALETPLEELDDFYKEEMRRIESQDTGDKRLAERVLFWVSCALEPLTLKKLQHALAVKPGESWLDDDSILDADILTSVCAGLIIIDLETSIIRPVHYTTQEYFKRIRIARFPGAQTSIAATCLTYISFDIFAAGPCHSDQEMEIRMHKYPLLEYAARHWGDHARGDPEETIKELAQEFLEHNSKVMCSNQVMHIPGSRYPGYSQRFPRRLTGLHIAASIGLAKVVWLLLEREGADVDPKDNNGWTPLSWAANKGHEVVVRLLIEREGVNVDSRDNSGQTPLSWAAESGHEAVVRLLFERDDVDVDSKDNCGRTPLSWAARNGYGVVAQLLVEREDVDVDSKDDSGRTPLSWAAEDGHEAVVRLLVEREGVDVNSKDDFNRTPLSWAARNGYEAVVRLLIERKGVDVDSKDDSGQAPLLWAAENGYEAVVRLLVERGGANVNSKDNSGLTTLSWAAEKGREAVVQLLVARDDIDVDSKDNNSRTPLSWAAESGHEAVVRLLVERDDVDVNSKDNSGRTPLLWAAERGHEVVVRLLVERNDVDANSKDNIGRTPLSWAAGRGHEAVVRLLAESEGVDANTKDDFGRTPLSLAAGDGHEGVVRLLVERKGVDVDSKDNSGRTPLSLAAENGSEAVVRLLVERGDVNVDSKDTSGRTPLSWAAGRGHEVVVRLLAEREGVDVDSKGSYGRTPLLLAAENGHEAVVRLLVERGDVDVDYKDISRRTPLSLAAENGHEAVVRLLVERGDVGVDYKDISGRTPLSLAAWNGHEAVVRFLVKHGGADVNSKDDRGHTPLSSAVINRHQAIVRLLAPLTSGP